MHHRTVRRSLVVLLAIAAPTATVAAQEPAWRTSIVVQLPFDSAHKVAERVSAAFRAVGLPISDSSTTVAIMSGVIVNNPDATYPFSSTYRADITVSGQTVSVRFSGTGRNGMAPPYPTTSKYFDDKTPELRRFMVQDPQADGWPLLERLAERLGRAAQHSP